MATVERRVSRDGKVSYRAKVRLTGYPPQSATFAKKTDAARWVQRTEADIRDGRYFPSNKAKKHSVSDLIDQYLIHVKATNPRRHDEVLPLLSWWKEEIGVLRLSAFSSDDVLQGQLKLLARKKQRKNKDGETATLTASTVNRYLVALYTAIGFGIKPLRWIDFNPVGHVDKLEEPPGRTRFLTPDEIKRLINACNASKNPHLLAIVLIGISTGARRNEIRQMKWSDVGPEAKRIVLPKTKNHTVRSVPAVGVVAEILKRMHGEKTDDQIFLFPSPNDPNKPVDFESAWVAALKRAEITDFRFHDLRHTCGSYLAMNGASLIELAEALGHKTLQIVRRYTHLTESHTTKVISNMTDKVLGHVKL